MSHNYGNVERQLTNLFDGSDWNVYDPSIVNLGVGAPGTDLLQNCCDIFETATAHRLKNEKQSNALLFQYGATSGPYEARRAIADYLTGMYEDKVESENLLITSGATQGLHVILSTLVDLNGFVFVDEVTYMIALDAIKQFTTLTIVPVRLNENGVDLQDFERLLAASQTKTQQRSKEYWAMYYAIPTYHNPTGILFTPDVCRGLIRLARKYDILIACDDVYNILNYTAVDGVLTPSRLLAYDCSSDSDYRGGNVVSNGSFSKTIAPGIRLGWIEAPARVKTVLEASGILNSGGCLNNYMAGIAASLFELGLAQSHIQRMHAAYKERMLATCAVLRRELPTGCSMLCPGGGYFIWITLPRQCDALALQKFCLSEERIYFIAGARFAASADCAMAAHSLRISIAFHGKEKLVDAAHRLCAAIGKFLQMKEQC